MNKPLSRLSKSAINISLSIFLTGFAPVSPVAAGEFQVDWGTFDWPAGFTGPVTRTWSDQYGFEIDVEAELSGTFQSYVDGTGAVVPSPDDVDFFGGNVESLVVVGDARANEGAFGDNRITATVRAQSGGVAFPVDSLEIDVLDIDSTDNNSREDRCDFVTGFGNNGNPTFSTLSATPSVLVGPGPGSGLTGTIGANQAQCIYIEGATVSPTSPNDSTGSVRATFPNGTSEATFWYDESIQNVRNYSVFSSYNPGARGIGMFGNVGFTVDQSINLTRSVSPNSAIEADTITYTYVVENTGALPFNPNQDMIIEDSLLGTVTCPAITAPIAPGGTVTCTGSYTVTAADVLAGAVDSTATAGIGAIGQPFVSRLQSNTENASLVTSSLLGTTDPQICTPENVFAKPRTQLAGSGNSFDVQVGDIYLFDNVTTDTNGNALDMVVEFTEVSNATSIVLDTALDARMTPSENGYVIYNVRLVQDGSAVPSAPLGTLVEQSRISGVIAQHLDVDSRGSAQDSTDVVGFLDGNPVVSLFNTAPLASYPSGGSLYTMDPAKVGNPLDWLEEANESAFDNYVTYEYSTFTQERFIHGYTGTSTTAATRGTSFTFCAISNTSATVVAEDDDYTATPVNTLLGGTAGEVLANDTVNGLPATSGNVTLEVLTAAQPVNSDDPVPYLVETGLDAGRVIVPENVPSGTYQIDYEICDVLDPLQCDRAKVLVAVFDGLGVDFSDAPISYLVAAHGVDTVPSVYLGSVPPDIEAIAQSDATATADDLLGTDDEDSVMFPILTQGTISTVDVGVTGNGFLQAWIDFNGDGLFEETLGERIAIDLQDNGTGADNLAGDGVIQITVTVPSDATTSTTFARFRYSSETGLPVSSFAVDGEVEDYSLVIAETDLVDRGDAPASYGDPRHIVVPSIYLGAGLPDTEVLTQHSSGADADDLSGLDDEDSIAVFPVLEAGTTVSLTVQTHETLSNLYDAGLPVLSPGVTNLQLWIDWDQSGTFETSEQVAIDYRDGGAGDADGVFNNQITMNIAVPNTIVSGLTFARVRWSTSSAVATDPFDGLNFDGEVEDYQVRLSAGAVPFLCDGTLYRVAGISSQLQELVFTENGAGGYTIADATVGTPAGVDYNAAWGYNALDGLFYGVVNGTRDLVRVDSSGNFTVISTIPTTAAIGDGAGDIMENGIMVYRVNSGNAFQLLDLSNPFAPLDLGQLTFSAPLSVADIAYNPNDGFFYGINATTNRLFYFDPLAGTAGATSIVEFGPATFTADYGAVWFDYYGRFYINQNNTNEVFQVDVGFEGDGDGAATVIDTLTLPSENRVNAASCPSRFGPLPPEGSVQGLVYNDSNLSGTPDSPSETGIAGITVSAYDNNSTPENLSDDTLVAATQTDSLGQFTLEGLSALRVYRIEVDEADEDLPIGAQITSENPYPNVRVTAGSRSSGYDFGFASTADLSITKVALDTNGVPLTEAQEGTEIDFNLTVTNDGTNAVTGVKVRDLLPNGFSYVSDTAAASGDTYDLGTGVWDIGDLAAGSSISLTIRATMNATGEHTNVAEIIASSLNDPDSDPAVGPLTDDLSDGIADDDEASVTVTFVGGGSVLSGTVFQDNGAGSGTAFDGVQNGLEVGTPAAKVEVFNGAGTLIDSPEVAADGTWSLTLPDSFAGPVTLQVTAAATHLVISETPAALPFGVNTDPRDGRFTFTPDPDEDYAGLDVGVLKQARLREDQSGVIGAGQVAELRHEFIVDAEGSVAFSVTPLSETPAGGYSHALFEDTNCDGTADTVISGALTTSPDQLICLVLRVSASSSIGPNASYVVQLDAITTYGATGVSELDRNTDRLTTEASTGALRLYKTVRNITQGGAEGVRNGGAVGDVLEYSITVENPSAAPASEITIYDRTPPYTELFAPIVSPSALGDMICTLITPSGNSAGYAGNLEWDCVGAFLPGSRGNVAFQVQIAP
ncbi:putative repeat protein (TIGR01451 family) [Pacificibacter maritimus]|uniref:Putative repeat protein (TIGR01451 family) n=1 Tax=Pacificibacter maritimus TaxID=762213 RepID=A0A3N4ULP4_9RHOB|nr:DUF11 domain-containing protein [Pacificibacter maritimus]RPE70918.1 putative repeat protein (TIGR01451 family) [Pacificibacter maritimus]